jgi:hypothetical protein
MKTLRLVKRIKNLTPHDERVAAVALHTAREGVQVILDYLSQEIILTDKQLSDTSTLYDRSNADRYVGVLLAYREANFKLMNLLQAEVELDGDQPED